VAYFAGVGVAAALFAHQQRLIRDRRAPHCFAAFRNNVWVGFALFAGTVIQLSVVARLH
jgi:4-hydroxybenzoate polyprenyltransferase